MTSSRRLTGFTLTEIMIVVAIIGIIIAIAVPGFIRARERARQTACQENLIRIDQAIQQYIIEENVRGDLPLTVDLDYLIGETMYLRTTPVCPSGGTYTLNLPNDPQAVDCSIGYDGFYPHVFPAYVDGPP